MEREFTAVFERDGEWVIGWAEDLPGAFGQGRTLDEAREDLREAIKLMLEDSPEITEQQEPAEQIREKMLVAI